MGDFAEPDIFTTDVLELIDLNLQGGINAGKVTAGGSHLLDATALFLPEGREVARFTEKVKGGGLKFDESFAIETTHSARGQYP